MRTLPAFVLATALLLATGTAQAGRQDFTLVNSTGYQIDEVYVSDVNNRNWGSDIMGRDALANGASVAITFNAGDNVCRWDMKVKYHDGDQATWTNLNLCNISKVTLFWNSANQTTTASVE